LLIAVLGAALWAVDRAVYFRGLVSSDEMNYADVGRQIATGHGVTQRTFLPGFLRWYHGESYQPYFVHPPGLPLLIGAIFRTHGVSDATAILASAYAYVGTGVALAALVLSLGARPALAVLSAILFYVNGWSTWYAIASMSEIPHAFLVVLLFLLTSRGGGPFLGAVTGALWALSYLVRQSSVLLLPSLVLFAWLVRGRQRDRRWLWWGLGFGLAAVVVLAPEVLREIRHFGRPGNPFLRSTMLINTPVGDAGWIFLYGHPAGETSPLGYFLANPEALGRKYLEYSAYSLRFVLPFLLSPTLASVPLPGILGRWTGRFGALKASAWVALLLTALVSPLSFVSGAYFVYLTPLMATLIADTLLWVIEGWRAWSAAGRAAAALVFLHFVSPPVWDVARFLTGRHERPGDLVAVMAQRGPIRAFFATRTAHDDVIVTPLAVPASWLAGRRTVAYSSAFPPADTPMWRQIEGRLPITAIVHSSLHASETADPLLPGFVLADRARIEGIRFRLYRRHEREPVGGLGRTHVPASR
jgi:4-amino-4-deoxy-L-arabinose transferase-like glycosyltransferase